MEFEQYRDEVANYLEDAGVGYTPALDDQIWQFYAEGVKSWQVPGRLSQRTQNPEA